MRIVVFAVCAVALIQSALTPLRAQEERLHELLRAEASAARSVVLKPRTTATPCFGNSIACGQTFHGFLSLGCSIFGTGPAADFFSFDGISGQQVTVTMSSSAFVPFVDLQEPTGKPGDGAAAAGTASGPAVVHFTLDNTGSWTIGAANINSLLTPESGNFTLALQCSGVQGGGCVPDDNSLCLGAGRFKVTATFDAGASGSGAAHVVSQTDDTGYLWFFGASNVEAVVKVLDACSLGGHYWVFAGGLTNVNTVITVTDTQTGHFKTYTNPAGKAFQPIQDTSALPCT